jgi:hypothetical protein
MERPYETAVLESTGAQVDGTAVRDGCTQVDRRAVRAGWTNRRAGLPVVPKGKPTGRQCW